MKVDFGEVGLTVAVGALATVAGLALWEVWGRDFLARVTA